MLKGIEYAHSRQKRAFDLMVVGATSPAYGMARLWAGLSLRQTGLEAVRAEERVGRDGKPFDLHKLHGLNKKSLDELGQMADIARGDMSMVARRPINNGDHEEFLDNINSSLRDRWLTVVFPTKPGLVSSHAINFHTDSYATEVDQFVARAELDIKDVIDGSLQRDATLLASIAFTAVQRDFK